MFCMPLRWKIGEMGFEIGQHVRDDRRSQLGAQRRKRFVVRRQLPSAPRRQRQQKAVAFDRQDQRKIVILRPLRLRRRIQEDSLPPPVSGTLVRRRRLVPAGAVARVRIDFFSLDRGIAEPPQPFCRARAAPAAIHHQVRLDTTCRVPSPTLRASRPSTRGIVTRRKQPARDLGPFDELLSSDSA